MAITLNLTGGAREETTVNLSAALSSLIAGNGGVFPSSASIYIKLERAEVGGVGGTVEDWGIGDEETVVL
jgi:hypothetical protein